VPGGGKAKPAMRPKPSLPKCKALFDYQAQDLDELNLVEGDVIEILKEGSSAHFALIKVSNCE
jgi:SH3 domain